MPTYTVSQLFDGPFAIQADFTALVSRWATVISEAATYSSSDFTTLDADSSGTLDYDDLDMHLHRLAKKFYPVAERWPTSWDNANSDPLGLRSLRGGNTIIIDPQSATAVNVTQSTNTCLTQAGVSAGNLFSGDTYLQTLWLDLRSLDEVGNTSIRRFPTNGGKVTIYVRGGSQNLTNEITLQEGTSGWTNLDRITVRAYPGEQPTVYCCNSEYTTGAAARLGKWRFAPVISATSRPYLRIFDIRFVGWVRKGFGKVYAPQLMSLTSATTQFWLRDCEFLENVAIHPAHSRADDLPDQVDATFAIRWNNDSSVLYPAADVGQTRTINLSSGANGTIEGCYFRPSSIDFPYSLGDTDDVFNGEGINMEGCDGVTIKNCKFEGVETHSMIHSDNCLDITIQDCDISNLGHTCILINGDDGTGGYNHTIQRNRIHTYCRVAAVVANAIEAVGMYDSTISDNVIYNDGLETSYSGVQIAAAVGSSNNCEGNTITRNVLVGVSMGMEYTSTACGTPGTNKIFNNTISNNVIVDVPDANVTSAYYGAPLRIGLDQPLTNNTYGNTITGNVIRNTRGSYQVSTSTRGTVTTNYATTSTTIPGMTSNVTTDPLFNDVAAGDFRMGNSTVAALMTTAPLVPSSFGVTQRQESVITNTRNHAADVGMARA